MEALDGLDPTTVMLIPTFTNQEKERKGRATIRRKNKMELGSIFEPLKTTNHDQNLFIHSIHIHSHFDFLRRFPAVTTGLRNQVEAIESRTRSLV